MRYPPGITQLSRTVIVMAVLYTFVNTVTDILYGWVDPRIRVGKRVMGLGWWSSLPFAAHHSDRRGVIIALLALAAVAAPWIAPYSLDYVNPEQALGAPSAEHLREPMRMDMTC